MWKKKSKVVDLPTQPVDYPVGTCVRTESGTYYIGVTFKHPISSDRILNSWRFPVVIETSDVAVSKYLKGKPLGFRAGTVIYDFSTGQTFAISGSEKRLIENPDRIKDFGLDFTKDVVWVSKDEAALHKEGRVIK